jgi:hydrogenase maturation protease
VRAQVRAHRVERRLGGRALVDADGIRVQQPGDRRISGAKTLDLLDPDRRAEPLERMPVELVDPVEQREDAVADGLVERLDLAEQVLQLIQQLIEARHGGGTFPDLNDTRRILIACVGNPLRRDDGFGYAVAVELGTLPAGVQVLESGIGGMTVVQELMRGWDGLIVVDAVDRDAAPGTVFLIEPEIGEPSNVPDIHLANPDRVLALASGLGCLPERRLLVGCQPEDADGVGEYLSPPVRAAVRVAVERIHETLRDWLR